MNFFDTFCKTKAHQLIIVLSFVILTISYSTNIFHITDNHYRNFDKADEGNVIGRMILAKEQGIFSKGGLTGQYFSYKFSKESINDEPESYTFVAIDTLKLNMTKALTLSYDNYINNRLMIDGKFHAYQSQPGGQAITYSILQSVLPFDGKVHLPLFRFMTIALSALAFALFIGWVSRNFGILPAIITFLLILFSAGIYRFAFNLWWALWSFYIPFVTMLLVLEKREKKEKNLFDNTLLLILGLTMFLKFFFTGGEFITSALVMAICPIIFYLIWKNVKIKFGLLYFIKSSIAASLATMLGLALMTFQNKCYLGTWNEALNYVVTCFTRHSTDPIEPTGGATFGEIASVFFTNDAFYSPFTSFTISYIAMLCIITLFSLLLYLKNRNQNNSQSNKIKALIITTTIGVLAPISWLIFFPLHVLHHQMFDFITWYMPYCLLGFTIIGLGCQLIYNKVRNISSN